jgi:hypothetical protein
MLDVLYDRVAESSALPDVTDARGLLSDSWIHPCLPADGLPGSVFSGVSIESRPPFGPEDHPLEAEIQDGFHRTSSITISTSMPNRLNASLAAASPPS